MKTIFFVQQSPALAGSQKSLLRLMRTLDGRWQPVLIAGSEGWLTGAGRSAGIPVIVHPFPSVRSLYARLIGTRLFARKVAKACQSYGASGSLVHGNDHIQSLAALAIAKVLHVPSVLTLRTPGMNHRDFLKYACHRHGHLVAVGHDLHRKVCGWCSDPLPQLIENGVDDQEINPALAFAEDFPLSVVVPGSTEPRKGWRDLVDALVLLESQGRGAATEFALLGNDYGQDVMAVAGADRLKTFRVKYLPLTADFKKAVSSFSFAVHPSRSESFGMALLEMLAAGVPVLAGRTGVAERVITDSRFLFEPQCPADLAEKLVALMDDFSGAGLMVKQAQKIILDHYCVTRTVAQYMELYSNLTAD